ncbi:sigma-70 family RNA polymerase sigma factor [Blastopirellula marina]|uniref:Probable extracytoplasmic function alternative sigma factor n=1 Tax=Blastopirellula marina DSM 3645 TaxID=314230 RepID=A3ZU20_9BACT|nr:sigma-70 family RNA polymerase sigma factor [Blastopirellula marina]EAQ80083.1 probable extracytoplasmic function alternative sigma factor [Blastopirellula marina DSM 3645]
MTGGEQRRPSSGDAATADAHIEQFIQLLAENERLLAVFVMTMVPHSPDADDILQDTKIALWRNFDQFELGTDFGAWARRTAFHRILAFRKKKGRDKLHCGLSQDCYAMLAKDYEADVSGRVDWIRHLKRCLLRLPEQHQQIIQMRYEQQLSIDRIAATVDRTPAAIYRVLSRIRLALRDCIRYGESSSSPVSEPYRSDELPDAGK